MADRIDTLGWNQDPAGRHQLRYHDGATFTQYVCDNGVVGVDAPPPDRLPPVSPRVVGRVLPPVYARPAAVAPVIDAPNSPTPPSGHGVISGAVPPQPEWISVDPPIVPAAAKRRGLGLLLSMSAVVVEAVVIAVLTFGLATTHSTQKIHPATPKPIGSTIAPSGSFSEYLGRVVYSSNFEANEGWSTGSLNANTTATVANGQYLVHGWTSVHHPLLSPYAIPQPGVSVEASATQYETGNVSIGSGCQSADGISPALVYQLVVYPDGQWYIEEARLPGRIQTLLSGQTRALGEAASLQLTCVITASTSDTLTTQLVGYVDGVQVGAIGDQTDRVGVTGYVPILVLGSFGPRVSAAFTNITVRSVSPPEQPQLQRQRLGFGVSVDRYMYPHVFASLGRG